MTAALKIRATVSFLSRRSCDSVAAFRPMLARCRRFARQSLVLLAPSFIKITRNYSAFINKVGDSTA